MPSFLLLNFFIGFASSLVVIFVVWYLFIRPKIDLEYQSKLDSKLKDKELEFILEKKELENSLKEKYQQKKDELLEKIDLLKESLHDAETEIVNLLKKQNDLKSDIENQQNILKQDKYDLDKKTEELAYLKEIQNQDYQKKLGLLAELTPEKAKSIVLDQTRVEMGLELLEWQKKYLLNIKDEANQRAMEIVALTIQRCSSEVANEFTITTVKLENDDQKGKIIGKGGRNLQWLEKILGVEFIIDESPEIITISGFNSIRRHIAKKTVELLLEDGRIHPGKIEEMQIKAKAALALEIADAGQEAVNELGIIDFPPKLIRLIGRLKFRTSYGQNMLRHSLEMAKLAGLIASDLNQRFPNRKPIDIDICKKGALLHDIGKAIDEETTPKGDHVDLGIKVCDTFDLDPRIKKCISSHHDESYWENNQICMEAVVVDICDNISGTRLGARKETAQAYFQRVEGMEKIANKIEGVKQSWIMRGARELWVFFDTDKISPDKMHQLTRDISIKIQAEIKFPSEIKVIGFWEDRYIEYIR